VSAHAASLSANRIGALVLRYWYLLRGSWPRLLELAYWPAVQLLMWGFLQLYLARETGLFATASGVLLGAVMLWDVLFRGQLGFSISFLEEMYSRNLGHLLVSPLRPIEFVCALMVMSVIRVAIGLGPVTLLAIGFFGFNIYSLGLMLVVFFLNLILTSWAIGLFVCGLVVRNGMGAESLAWSLIFLLLPLCCVYYPVTILPGWLQVVAYSLAPTYVFEGMRALLIDGTVRLDLMAMALGINVVYFGLGLASFYWFFRQARRHGSILQVGE
jgi:ABC-2 type transport system permease protein